MKNANKTQAKEKLLWPWKKLFLAEEKTKWRQKWIKFNFKWRILFLIGCTWRKTKCKWLPGYYFLDSNFDCLTSDVYKVQRLTKVLCMCRKQTNKAFVYICIRLSESVLSCIHHDSWYHDVIINASFLHMHEWNTHTYMMPIPPSLP